MTATRQKTQPEGHDAGTITTKQMRELHALLRDHGITGDTTVHDYLNTWLAENDDDQHPIASRSDLHATTAARIIRDLRGEKVARAPGGLARALIEVQKGLPVVQKTKTARVTMKGGGEYSYTYADLADVTDAAMPLMTSHGLAFMAKPRVNERGSYELAGVLLHESGEREEGALPLHGNNPQEIGGAITYMRRYLLGCMLGIVTDDDADGRQAASASRTRAWDGPSTKQLLDQIGEDADRVGVTYEQVTAKMREGLRVQDIGDLDGLDPWLIAPWAAKIRSHAEDVVEKREAEQMAAAEAAQPATQEPAAAAEDPWATPATGATDAPV